MPSSARWAVVIAVTVSVGSTITTDRARLGATLRPCVLPATRHLNYSDSCDDHADIIAGDISWAAQRGEFESVQVLLAPQLTSAGGELSVSFTNLQVGAGGASLDAGLLSWKQLGYVYVRHTSRYADSGCPGNADCWRSDPLLPPAANHTIYLPGGRQGQSQSLWITIQVPRNATPAHQSAPYTGEMKITFTPLSELGEGSTGRGAPVSDTIKISLEVWDVTVPTTADATVQHDWNFNVKNVLSFYPEKSVAQVANQWWDFMEAHRLPPMDNAAWDCPPESIDPVCVATRGTPSYLADKTTVLVSGLHDSDCNCSSCPPEIAKRNAIAMAPVVKAAKRVCGARLLGYGFDERPRSCEKSIRTAFAAFLEQYPIDQFPEVGGTMAALNWAGSSGHGGPTGSHPSDGGMPLDMPYTDWVLQYQYYNETTADAWVQSSYKGRNRTMWLYHCIEPSGVNYLNIFIERPLIEARLLFWLASTQNIQGWLYWATDLWRNCPSSPHSWQRQNITIMRRINGTAFTDFLAGSTIWCNQKLYDFWVNGDGYYMYPGPDGPISTSRLEAIRDALEDLELFRLVPKAVRKAAVSKLVRSPTDHEDKPLLLEEVRREIGRQAHLFAKKEG